MIAKIVRHACAALLLVVCTWRVSFGGTITDLLNSSDAVVIATPRGFSARGNTTLFSLSVTLWLSPPTPSQATSLPIVWAGPRLAEPSAPSSGIWFLKSRADGTYSPVPVVPLPIGKISDPRDLYYQAADRGQCPATMVYPANSALSEKIALEVACGAVFENTDHNPGKMVAATTGLSTSALVHNAFSYLAQLSGSRQKSIGVACLIAANEPTGVILLEQHLSDLTDQDLSRIVAGPLFSSWRSSEPAAIKSLGRIATGSRASGPFLRGAANALADVHTVDTLPYLARLLDNPDREAQYDAIVGFVGFVTGRPVHTQANTADLEYIKPSETSYSGDQSWKNYSVRRDSPDTDIQRAVAFWKSWLKAHPELPQAN